MGESVASTMGRVILSVIIGIFFAICITVIGFGLSILISTVAAATVTSGIFSFIIASLGFLVFPFTGVYLPIHGILLSHDILKDKRPIFSALYTKRKHFITLIILSWIGYSCLWVSGLYIA